MAHILIAEDDDRLRAFLCRGLRRAGHAVAAAADGAAALREARLADFDVLLADIVLPGMDGIALARLVADRQPWIRVLFITGFAAVAIPDGDLAGNPPPVLTKPFHLRHLVREIEALMTQGAQRGK